MSGCPGFHVVDPLCRGEQLVGSVGKSIGNDVFSAIAHYFAGVAKGAVSWLWTQLTQATSINLATDGIKRDLVATGAIAAVVTFTLFLIQVISSALRQDPGGLGRAVRGLAVSFIGAAFAVAVTQLVLAAVDSLCNGVVAFALGTDPQGLGSKLIAVAALGSITNPAGLLLISLVLIAAVVVVWVALMIRKMLIIVSAVFAPVAFSGASSDISRSWVRRWIEFTVALVFSKLILVIIFMIGLSVLEESGQGGASESITNLVIGALTLLLAGLAPWIAIKMVHFAGDSFQVMHQQAAGAMQPARTMASVPQKFAMLATAAGSVGAVARSSAGSGTWSQPTGQSKSPPPGSPGQSPPPMNGSGPAPGATGAGPATDGAGLNDSRTEPARHRTGAPPRRPAGGTEPGGAGGG